MYLNFVFNFHVPYNFNQATSFFVNGNNSTSNIYLSFSRPIFNDPQKSTVNFNYLNLFNVRFIT